ncbi:MAG: hypothetical protein AAF357_14580, partial [Verrucomicrobiota bacterium]
GQLTIWVDGNFVAKVKNETRIDESVSVQEAWLVNNQPVFFFDRSEWHGNQDNSVSINEYSYYLINGQVIREMTRSATRQKGGNLDISGEPHQINDDFDPEYGASLFEDKKTQIAEFIKTANSLSSRDGGAPDLLTWPFRLMLQTLSPDGQYGIAWGLEGVPSPDWLRWEKDYYDYLTAIGNPAANLHLVDLATGASLGIVEAEFEPGGSAPYFWTKWSEDGSYFVAGSDYRWATGSATVYRMTNGFLAQVTDLSSALSRYSIEALRQADHPYAIDASETMGFIDLKTLSADGTIDLSYLIESKFEGVRRNAGVDMRVSADFSTGDVRLLSSQVKAFAPFPTSWEKFKAMMVNLAPQWISAPPALEDYLQLETFIDDGIHHLYNQFGGFLNQDLVEVLIQRPLFTSSPHYPGGVLTTMRFDFGHYDPESIKAINRQMERILSPEMVNATRDLYNAEFSGMAKHFQEALHYWHANPSELERQKKIYLDHLKNETLPEYYYLLDGDLANNLMEGYSEDWTQQSCYLTGLRFWLRRSCDGSYPEFANLLQQVISKYDPAYFAYRGIPALKIAPANEEDNGSMSEVIMDEAGALGVNHLTSFDQATLQEKLAGFTVTSQPYFDQGGQYPSFLVQLGTEEVLQLIRFDSGDPLAFEARSSNIQLRNGVSTGDTFSRVFETQRPLGLFIGLETDIGAVMVEAPGSERITLLFQPPPGNWPEDPNLKRDDIANFILTEMRWMP